MSSAIVLIPIAGLGSGGYMAWNYLNTEQIDTAFCYERDDQYQSAIFVDFSHTQSTTASQESDLVNALSRTFRQLPPNGQVSIFTTSRENAATVVDPAFTLCKPAKNAPEQKKIGAPDKSPAVLKRESMEADEAFARELESLAQDSKNPEKAARSSPILEQIRGISEYDFNAPLRKLVVFSDGINNSSSGKFCQIQGELPMFSKFEKSSSYQFVKPNDLSGVDVEFLLVEFGPLPTKTLPFCTTAELRQWWVDYAKGNGAKSVRLTPLGLGAG
ncbi:MAG: hypothetical protein ACSHYC_21960 [Alphaproteobacteria bacterium]